MAKGTSKIVLLTALSLLVLAPIVSYFYLDSGYEYRKMSLELLKPKGEVQPFNFAIDAERSIEDDRLSSKVTVMAFTEDKKEEDLFFEQLLGQYGEREEFQIMHMIVGSTDQTSNDQGNIITFHSNEATAQTFFENSITDTIPLTLPTYVLIDTASQIRRLYQGDRKEVKRELIEHIAIVLPRTKKSDIIHKNSVNEE